LVSIPSNQKGEKGWMEGGREGGKEAQFHLGLLFFADILEIPSE
jgi:hypothetical protein